MKLNKFPPEVFNKIIIIGVFIWFFGSIFVNYIYRSILSDAIDLNVKNNQFKTGYVCYADYKPSADKSGVINGSSYKYYFYIDGEKNKNITRPYFPFNNQWREFIKNMNRDKCYEAKYVEVNVLYLKRRVIYELLSNQTYNPYLKKDQ